MPRGSPPMTLDALQPYYSGAFFTTAAIKSRLARLGPEGRTAMEVVSQYQKMVAEFRDALARTVEMQQG